MAFQWISRSFATCLSTDSLPTKQGDGTPLPIGLSCIETDTGKAAVWNGSTWISNFDNYSFSTLVELVSRKNTASGYAGLDGNSKLTGSQQVYGTSSNTATQGNDSRLSDARTPTAHASTHQPGGSDVMAVDAAAATGSLRTLGTSATAATAGNDARLSDARTPLAHVHVASDVTGTAVLTADARLSDARTPLAHTHVAGDVTGTAVLTADSRLSDARTPLTHGNSVHTVGVAPADVTKAAAIEGTSAAVARADHKHDVSTAVAGASSFADTASEGTATSLARSDHRHSREANPVVDPVLQSYAPGSFTVSTGKYIITSNNLKITGTQRITLQGTARWRHT